MALPNNINKDKISVYQDIFQFTKKIYKKYKIPLSFNLLKQLEKEDNNELMKISLNIMNELLNFKNGDDIEFEDINEDQQSVKEEDNEVESGLNKEDNNFDENNSSEEEDDNCKTNIFENKELTKKKTKVKIIENDFHEIYEDENNNKDEEILEKKGKN